MNADGSGVRTFDHNALSTSFGPDSLIVFGTLVGQVREIASIRSDGTGYRVLTRGDIDRDEPVISPDGRMIAFNIAPGGLGIHVMNADGTGERRISNSSAYEHQPVFSPDSQRILFVSNRDGVTRLYSMNLYGGDLRLVESSNTGSSNPDWR